MIGQTGRFLWVDFSSSDYNCVGEVLLRIFFTTVLPMGGRTRVVRGEPRVFQSSASVSVFGCMHHQPSTDLGLHKKSETQVTSVFQRVKDGVKVCHGSLPSQTLRAPGGHNVKDDGGQRSIHKAKSFSFASGCSNTSIQTPASLTWRAKPATQYQLPMSEAPMLRVPEKECPQELHLSHSVSTAALASGIVVACFIEMGATIPQWKSEMWSMYFCRFFSGCPCVFADVHSFSFPLGFQISTSRQISSSIPLRESTTLKEPRTFRVAARASEMSLCLRIKRRSFLFHVELLGSSSQPTISSFFCFFDSPCLGPDRVRSCSVFGLVGRLFTHVYHSGSLICKM